MKSNRQRVDISSAALAAAKQARTILDTYNSDMPNAWNRLFGAEQFLNLAQAHGYDVRDLRAQLEQYKMQC